MTKRHTLLAAAIATFVAGCADPAPHDYANDGFRQPAAPFAYGSYQTLDKERPYQTKFDPNLIFEGYTANLARNRTFSGRIQSWDTVTLDESHPARVRFKTVAGLSNRDSLQGLAVYQVVVRLDRTGELVPVLVENTRVFEAGQSVFIVTHGSPTSGFVEMPEPYPTEWHEGYSRDLLPDSDYIGEVRAVTRCFVREDNPAFPRLRNERFGINVGRGRIDTWLVDMRLMNPDGRSHYVRAYVPVSQAFTEREKIILRTHGDALNGWIEVRGYAESLGQGVGNNRHEAIQPQLPE